MKSASNGTKIIRLTKSYNIIRTGEDNNMETEILINKQKALEEISGESHTYNFDGEIYLQIENKEMNLNRKAYNNYFWTYVISSKQLKEAEEDKNGNVKLERMILIWNISFEYQDGDGEIIGEVADCKKAINWEEPDLVLWDGDLIPLIPTIEDDGLVILE